MLQRYRDRFSWVTLFLQLIRVAALVIVVVGAYNTLSSDKYTSNQWATLFFAGLAQGSIYALIALGYTLVYGILLMINFAHGEVFMAGAFTAAFLANAFKASGFLDSQPLIAIILLILLAAAVSTGVALLLERIGWLSSS
jgi:branched-chain amino acid transport system permease protein